LETLGRFQQNQRVIEDFTARTLAAIPSDYGRLFYVASLRDPETHRYVHEGLTTIYPEAAVQQALEHCHSELFCKVLETPLERQEWDLRACLGALDYDLRHIVAEWQKPGAYLGMIPLGLPPYLGELFCSNLRLLLEVFADEEINLRGAA
jgi:hypothetical protein